MASDDVVMAREEWDRIRDLEAENERLREALVEWLAADEEAERDFTEETDARLTAAMEKARELAGAFDEEDRTCR